MVVSAFPCCCCTIRPYFSQTLSSACQNGVFLNSKDCRLLAGGALNDASVVGILKPVCLAISLRTSLTGFLSSLSVTRLGASAAARSSIVTSSSTRCRTSASWRERAWRRAGRAGVPMAMSARVACSRVRKSRLANESIHFAASGEADGFVAAVALSADAAAGAAFSVDAAAAGALSGGCGAGGAARMNVTNPSPMSKAKPMARYMGRDLMQKERVSVGNLDYRV